MTDARAAAVEAAALGLVNRERARFELPPRDTLDTNATGHVHARFIAETAITAYLAHMAEAGWVMVPRDATVGMVEAAIARPDYGASNTLFYGEIYRAMVRAAMLGSVDTTTPIADALG